MSTRSAEPRQPEWRPTIAHVRATASGLFIALLSVLLRRPDLLVLSVPLLAIAGWSAWTRPRHAPVVHERLDHATLREGEATSWRIDVRAAIDANGNAPELRGVEDVTAVLAAPPFVELEPASGAVSAPLVDGVADFAIPLRSTRWGRRSMGPATVVATSSWGAFRWQSGGRTPRRLTSLPLPAMFDAAAPLAHPVGLVGMHRSARPGEGSEFASVRPFQIGDRLRRIHWPRSLRTGELHVTSTWSEQDSHVVLVIDALNDLGKSDGIDGAASSLDTAVRAAGAIAEHYLRHGDRVSMHVMGARGLVRVPPASGTSHLRRLLDTLATIEAGTDHRSDGRLQFGFAGAGALVVMLSPLVAPANLQRAISLSRRGFTVVVIDTLPAGVTDEDPEDPFRALAWRIRLLERASEIRRVRQAGVPVVSWRGPGSLDQVLRDLHRRAGAPRVTRR